VECNVEFIGRHIRHNCGEYFDCYLLMLSANGGRVR
jgi:hypothetical protein